MPEHPEAATKLRKAVRELYHVFGRCRGESYWVDCMDDVPPERASRPERLPVKDLSWADVEYFFTHALCGDPRAAKRNELNATRYFLPKVLEFNSREGWPVDERLHCWVCDWWFIGERLRHTAWHHWPTEERTILNWFHAWLEAIVLYRAGSGAENGQCRGNEPINRRLKKWLAAASELDLEFAEYMPRLDSIDGRQLPGFVQALIYKRLYHPAGNGFLWDTDDPSRQQPLADWMLSQGTAKRLEESFFECGDAATESRISITLDLLEGIKASLAWHR